MIEPRVCDETPLGGPQADGALAATGRRCLSFPLGRLAAPISPRRVPKPLRPCSSPTKGDSSSSSNGMLLRSGRRFGRSR